ncbi:MAG: cell division ATPase MinD [Haloferacaceae archaeon]
MGTVFTVASAKGGVGKTTTTASLGTTLAAAGHDVVAVDGDIGMANLATVLGLDPDGPTLHAVLSGDADVEDAIYEGPDGLAVVPGSTDIDDFRKANATALGDVVARLREYDYVLLDTGAGLSHDNALPLGLADEVVLVSSPEPPALIDTDKTRQLADRLDAHVRGLVLTRITENVTFEVPDQVNLDVPVLARIPHDAAVVEAFAARKPLCTHAPESAAALAYRELAEELTGESIAVQTPSAPATDPQADAPDSTADERTDSDAAGEPDETADGSELDGGGETGDGETGDDEAAADGETAGDDSEAAPDTAEVAATAGDGSTEAPDADGSRSVDTGVANTLERVESTVGEGDDATADSGGNETDANPEESETDADSVESEASANPEESETDADSVESETDANPEESETDADSVESEASGSDSEPLVEEAEPGGGDVDGGQSAASASVESDERSSDGDEAAGGDGEDATDDEDEDGKRGGFFRRLLGG